MNSWIRYCLHLILCGLLLLELVYIIGQYELFLLVHPFLHSVALCFLLMLIVYVANLLLDPLRQKRKRKP